MHLGIRVTVNVAMSLNGYISGPGGRRVVISDRDDLTRVNDLRSSHDAILVGANTVLNDNPDLRALNSVNLGKTRVILDSRLKIPESSKVLDGSCRTVIFTSNSSRSLKNAEIIVMRKEELTIHGILEKMGDMGINSVLVEGGAIVINEFIRENIIDDFFLFLGNIVIPDGGVRLFDVNGEMRNIIVERKNFGDGILLRIDHRKLVSNI